MTALAVEGVSVRLGRALVLEDVSARVGSGEWVAIVGANGAGKSTLLRALAGLVRFDGTITVGGRPLADLGRRQRARAIAVVPQDPAIPAWLTVSEYVLLGRTPHLGLLAAEGRRDLAAASAALERLDLAA
ncbi:MAG: ABC transporter ATP-binding protein, partial [Actinobacteria bacterium]|nr:ABC transporter ATP-binding protein [Actinomycetota bacterium]